MTKLLPCPFCGAVPQFLVDGEAPGCPTNGCPADPTFGRLDGLFSVDQWNRRASIQTAAVVEALAQEWQAAAPFGSARAVIEDIAGELGVRAEFDVALAQLESAKPGG